MDQPSTNRDRFIPENASVDPAVDSWTITDTIADQYHMPQRAVTIYMRHRAAIRVAIILSEEWNAFQANPT